MLTVKRVVTFGIAGVLCTAAVCVDPAYGQDRRQRRWGSEQMPRAGVCFFQDVDYRGEYFCVGPDEDLDQLPPGTNDTISSFRVVGNVEMIVFKDVRFGGPSARFSTSVSDLRREGWNDQISSLRVTNASVAWDRDQAPVWSQQAMPKEGACFYRDVDFRGEYFCMPAGASYALVPAGFNDQISSIRILRAGGVLVFRDRDFGGPSSRVTSDVADLRRGGMNDGISSIRVF